eukprot:scaffold55982_cov60-Attheya_sp.AAC.1
MTVQQVQGRGYNVVVLEIPGIRSTPIMDHIPRTSITPAPASVNPIDKALAHQQGQLKGGNGRTGHPRDQVHSYVLWTTSPGHPSHQRHPQLPTKTCQPNIAPDQAHGSSGPYSPPPGPHGPPKPPAGLGTM